ncbi:MAG: hypothetical protein RLZ44_1508 [Pseudomonadota bacterium]
MGIRAKLLIPLLALAILFLLGLQWLLWPRFFAAQLEQHLVDEQARAEILGTALIHPLRNADLAQVYSILDSVLQNHSHWRQIALLDADGTRIYPFSVAAADPGDDLVELRHVIKFFGAPVGTLQIEIDVGPIRQQHDHYAREGQLLILSLLVLAILVSFPLQEKLITTPLQALAAAARQMAGGNFEARLPPGGSDEVGELIRSFDGMREEVKGYQERLHELAHYDTLTGLPNRIMLMDRLEHAIAHAHRNGKPLGLLFLDVDNFKAINDTLGHAAGDALVAAVAERLQTIMREGDTVARLGGDEFMIIVETMDDVAEAGLAAQRIVEAFSPPLQAGAHQIPVTASIGITTYPRDADQAPALVQNADIAMYRAKAAGGGTYRWFADDATTRDQAGLELRSQLFYALEREQYFLEFQPRIDLRSGKANCLEALIRWQPPGTAAMGPARFIPLLEQTGLIVEVGEWVLRESCRFIRDQAAAGLEPISVSVNLSARQFRDPKLLDKIERALQEYGVPAHRLELELTEGLIMENTAAAIEVLDALHALGVRLSIDDFGTGYSSLSYLKRFPVDFLKIDRSFVSDLPDDQDDAAIVRAIIALSRNLGIATIAEGVETERQAQFLAREGCDVVQGYLYSRPVGGAEILAWLAGQDRHQVRAEAP